MLLAMIMTTSVFAFEQKDLMLLIEEAAVAKSNAYLEVRNKIVEHGAKILPVLSALTTDESLSWQQQLIIRICYERIERKADIEKLLETDWYSHPKFDPTEPMPIVGPEARMGRFVRPELTEAGLWYYYLEREWKNTGEDGKISKHHSPDLWVSWCTLAVKDNPEERIWLLRICSEFLTDASPSPAPSTRAYSLQYMLQKEEKPDSAYVLEHRAPPPVASEPPFRLGTKIIKPAKQP
jgi:hypothetical protein